MEDDAWSFGVSAISRSHTSMLKSHPDFCIDFEEFDEDDDLKVEYPCPFCSEDFDLVGLCCHVDEEHPEARSGVCPVCTSRVGMNMVGHITTQHGNFFNLHKLKFYKDESQSPPSFSRKELQDGHIRSPFGGSSSAVSTSKMAPDPLLSFLYNAPATNRAENVHSDSSSEVSVEEKSSDHLLLERNILLSDKDQEEKAQRCKFVQGLVLSTILDDGL
ncbi:hypothetical protein FNV43_RR23591 [Rhamnella rubrinervis]|uniref:Uncharacterized protein n=1 Tax=Rhamnella rubrinervis TaxID=2594499 RepID=A0A8K0DYE0_9ROSA|nr:hypothetical protein FNV43_RR23591 [Rhamnella rubrinervis]